MGSTAMPAATEEIRGLERLASAARPGIEEYVARLRSALAPAALSLTVYGRALATDFDPARQSVQSVVVVEQVDPAALRRLAGCGVRLGRGGIAAPLVLTPAEIETSRDTYPLELLEIQRQHITLLGTDHFERLSFEPAHVRHQCERELRRLRIALRQALLSAAGRERLASDLLREAADPMLRTIRGMLWLRGAQQPPADAEIIQEVGKLASRDLAGLRGAGTWDHRLGWADFDRFYEDVVFLGEMVNGW